MTQALVTTDWLAEHWQDDNLRIVDIRGRVIAADQPLPHYFAHRAEYTAAHIPGAVFVDWTSDIVEEQTHSMYVANPARYAALMSQLGIGDDTFVVAYDDAGGMFAARLWWTLNYYGHSQAAILDGGWQKWTAENRPVTAEVPQVAPLVFTPRVNPAWRRTGDDVAGRDTAAQLMDVRTPAEFSGEASRATRAGHIPGAINVPRNVLLNPDGTMLPPAELRVRFAEAGIQLDAPETIVYCNGGVSASYGMLALHLAGANAVTVYDGSWKEWGNNPNRPIE